MVTVVTGNDKLSFKVQGQRVTSTKQARVREDHNVACKLLDGTLVLYKEPVKKPVVFDEPVDSKKSSKK